MKLHRKFEKVTKDYSEAQKKLMELYVEVDENGKLKINPKTEELIFKTLEDKILYSEELKSLLESEEEIIIPIIPLSAIDHHNIKVETLPDEKQKIHLPFTSADLMGIEKFLEDETSAEVEKKI